jgi:hypothetical protein
MNARWATHSSRIRPPPAKYPEALSSLNFTEVDYQPPVHLPRHRTTYQSVGLNLKFGRLGRRGGVIDRHRSCSHDRHLRYFVALGRKARILVFRHAGQAVKPRSILPSARGLTRNNPQTGRLRWLDGWWIRQWNDLEFVAEYFGGQRAKSLA